MTRAPGPEAFTARILDPNGTPAGVGVLVAERHILTCAHVVNAALGRNELAQERPAEAVALDFPLLPGEPQVRATVESWLPPPRDGAAGDDIAGLVLAGEPRAPEGAAPARLAVDPPRPGRMVRVFGCPGSRPDGAWVEATVQGSVSGARIQLDSRAALRIERGFSGSPVFDESIGQVVGLVALAPARAGERDSYALGTERLRLAWPAVLGEHGRRHQDAAEVTVLHVSGPRFGGCVHREMDDLGYLEAEHGLRPDLLVVTGDLTERGRPSEFRQAIEFLTLLSAAAGIPRRHVAIVPGSHDVNRMACQAYFAEQESQEAEPVPPYYPKWNQFAEAFKEFYADLSDATFTPDEPWTLFEMPDLAVVVAGLNSTMTESHLDRDHYGWVGQRQLRWFTERLTDYRRRQWLRLAAVHHDPASGNLRDGQALRETLDPHLARMLTHGQPAGRYELITIRRGSQDDNGPGPVAGVPPPGPRDERDELLTRIVEATRARYPDATVTERGSDRYLRVTRSLPAGITEQWPVGVVDGPVTQAAVTSFADGVHAQFASADPQNPSELVYDGPPAPDDLVRTARQRGVRLRSLIEYQGLLDLRPLARAQRERLANDRIYQERLYVPQRFRIVDHDARSGGIRGGLVEQVIGWLGADEAQLVVVLGDFGRGKTSFLRQLTRALPAELPGLLPILVELRSLEKAPSLETLLVSHLANGGVQDINQAKLRYMIQSGRVALLFDGFDELELRIGYDNAADYLRILLASVTDRAKVVLTSRTQHFRSTEQVLTALGEQVTELTMSRVVVLEDFSIEQIAEFLTKLYNGDEARARARLELIGDIANLLELAHNPRMLAFIAALDADRLRGVRSREGQISAADLYREIIDFWLAGEAERQSHSHGLPTLTKDERFSACSALALRLWASKNPTIALNDLSAEISATLTGLADRGFSDEHASHAIGSGSLLVRTEDGAFTFVHQSIMEWLVAAAAAAGPTDIMTGRRMSRLMTKFFTDLVGHDSARYWAKRTLAHRQASEIAKLNALDVLNVTWRPNADDGASESARPQNLAAVDLRGQDLNYRDLRGADLSEANLYGMHLRGADLSGASLSGADLRGARLVACALNGAVVTGSKWDRAVLLGCVGEPATAPELRAAALVGLAGRDGADVMVEPNLAPSSVAYSPDGTILAVGSHNVVELVNPTDHRTLRILRGHVAEVTSVAFSPDGSQLATGSADQMARIWDVSSGETSLVERPARYGYGQGIYGVAFSADGTRLAIATGENDVGIWNLAAGTTSFTSAVGGVHAVAFSPDGTLLATACDDHVVRMCDPVGMSVRATLTGHRGTVVDLAFSPDGTLLASASEDGTVRLWDVAVAATCDVLTREGPVRGVAFGPRGAELAIAGDDRRLDILDLATGYARTVRAGTAGAASLAFSAAGAMLASAVTGGPARLWRLSAGTARPLDTPYPIAARSVAFSSRGTLLAVSDDSRTEVLDSRTDAVRFVLESSIALAFSPDERMIATYAGNDAQIWDTATAGLVGTLHGHTGRVRRGAFSSDGMTLATVSDDGTTRLWDATKHDAFASFETLPGHASVAFSPDGKGLAVVRGLRTVQIWDASDTFVRRSGRILRSNRSLIPNAALPHDSIVFDVTFSPDGAFLATACGDGTAWIWAMPGGRSRVLRGHYGPVRAVAFSPVGDTLATASDDNTIRIWDLSTGKTVMTLVELPDGGYATLLPDGKYKLEGDPGDRLWWAVKLCRFRPGELDPYVPGLERLPADAPLL